MEGLVFRGSIVIGEKVEVVVLDEDWLKDLVVRRWGSLSL